MPTYILNREATKPLFDPARIGRHHKQLTPPRTAFSVEIFAASFRRARPIDNQRADV